MRAPGTQQQKQLAAKRKPRLPKKAGFASSLTS